MIDEPDPFIRDTAEICRWCRHPCSASAKIPETIHKPGNGHARSTASRRASAAADHPAPGEHPPVRLFVAHLFLGLAGFLQQPARCRHHRLQPAQVPTPVRVEVGSGARGECPVPRVETAAFRAGRALGRGGGVSLRRVDIVPLGSVAVSRLTEKGAEKRSGSFFHGK